MERWYNYHGYLYAKHHRSSHHNLHRNGNRTYGLWYSNGFGND